MYIIITVIMTIVGLIIGAIIVGKVVVKPTFEEIRRLREESAKHLDLYLLMNDWVHIKQNRKSLSSYFEKNGYKKIAIYGMNYVGETLVKELQGTNIEIAVGIDKNANSMTSSIKLVTIENFEDIVDSVIVTPIAFFDSIADSLEKKIDCPVVSIEDVVYEVNH